MAPGSLSYMQRASETCCLSPEASSVLGHGATRDSASVASVHSGTEFKPMLLLYSVTSIVIFKKRFVYLFLERRDGREGEREGEKH